MLFLNARDVVDLRNSGMYIDIIFKKISKKQQNKVDYVQWMSPRWGSLSNTTTHKLTKYNDNVPTHISTSNSAISKLRMKQ